MSTTLSWMIIVLQFQIQSQNFKTSKKIDAIKAYFFKLLGMYFVDDLMYLTMLTLEKPQHRKDK